MCVSACIRVVSPSAELGLGDESASFACLAALCIISSFRSMDVGCAITERRYVMKRYNVKGWDNCFCWLLGVCAPCATYQARAQRRAAERAVVGSWRNGGVSHRECASPLTSHDGSVSHSGARHPLTTSSRDGERTASGVCLPSPVASDSVPHIPRPLLCAQHHALVKTYHQSLMANAAVPGGAGAPPALEAMAR